MSPGSPGISRGKVISSREGNSANVPLICFIRSLSVCKILVPWVPWNSDPGAFRRGRFALLGCAERALQRLNRFQCRRRSFPPPTLSLLVVTVTVQRRGGGSGGWRAGAPRCVPMGESGAPETAPSRPPPPPPPPPGSAPASSWRMSGSVCFKCWLRLCLCCRADKALHLHCIAVSAGLELQ